MPELELAFVIGPAGDDAAMDRALDALASLPGTFGCVRYESPDGYFTPPTQPTRRLSPAYVPCRPDGGSVNEGSNTLVLDTEYGDCVLNLVRDGRYDWIYVQAPPGIAEDADRWLFSTAEGLLARFPFRVAFLVEGLGFGMLIIDLAADYESHGLPPNRYCDYLCPDEGGRLIRHPATDR